MLPAEVVVKSTVICSDGRVTPLFQRAVVVSSWDMALAEPLEGAMLNVVVAPF